MSDCANRVADVRCRVAFTWLAAVIVFGGTQTIGVAADASSQWRQFRGPNGQGHAATSRLPVKFGESENLTWKTPIAGRAWSSPVVLDGRVWMTTALNGGKSLRAVAVDLASGKTLHDVEVFAPEQPLAINDKNSHASPTPVVEAGRVYAHFGAMGTACLSSETADVLWRNNELVIDHKEGPGSSPVLFEDLLIVNCDGTDEQYVAALNTRTGKIVWKTPRSAPLRDPPDFRKAYSTPVLITVDGESQLVSTGADQLQAYNPYTGHELWRVRYDGFSNVPIPLYEKGMLYVCTGYTSPELWAIRTDGRGDVTETHVPWKFPRQVPANPSPVFVDGRIYMVSNQGVLTSVDAATGKQLAQKRIGGNYYASAIEANGKLYFSSEEGKVTVVAAGSELEVLSVNALDGAIMSTPAIDGDALLVRTDRHLYRFDDRSQTAAGP